MHSNGGLRNKEWWSELGSVLSNPFDACYFGIDGLSDTNHIHRVNVSFDKVMENAEAFITAGGRAHWEFLVFDYNEHQVDKSRVRQAFQAYCCVDTCNPQCAVFTLFQLTRNIRVS